MPDNFSYVVGRNGGNHGHQLPEIAGPENA